jgi:hypothetical protein
MIRIVLHGRTGNNLYQYALGRVLSAKHGVPLVLGAHWYDLKGWAEVSHFLNLPIKARVSRGGVPGSLASRALRKLTHRHIWEYTGVPFISENHLDQSFDPRFLDAPDDCVLFGYFQSPRYFESMSDELRTELNDLIRGAHASRVPPSASCGRDLKTTLSQPNSVAVHVRRGDYLQHPEFQVCEPSYYQRTMDEMRARIPDVRFFIFSDEPAWCRNQYQSPDTVVIDSGHAAANPLHDMYLMSLASHHIIANSTYSWWAAWIGRKDDQLVMMPDQWYAKQRILAPIEEKRGGDHWLVVS